MNPEWEYKLVIEYARKFFAPSQVIRKDDWVMLRNALQELRIKSVLEFGPGLSTCLFAINNCFVKSLETDRKYLFRVQTWLESTPAKDLVVIDLWKNDETYPLEGQWDLVFVDGAEPREYQIKLAKQHGTLDSYRGRTIKFWQVSVSTALLAQQTINVLDADIESRVRGKVIPKTGLLGGLVQFTQARE